MNTQKAFLAVVSIAVILITLGWLTSGNAEVVKTREYEVSVPAAKSDTQRMIEAYERLSDQYLSLVQNQLNTMSLNDRDTAVRLDRIEKKIDELSAKIDKLLPPKADTAPAEKITAPENKSSK